jgi:hypothetical protein
VAAGCVPDDKRVDPVALGGGADKDEEDTIAAEDVTAIGVPVCTATAGMREHDHDHDHDHEIVPLSSHGYGLLLLLLLLAFSSWPRHVRLLARLCWWPIRRGSLLHPVHAAVPVHVQRRQPQLLLDYLSSRGASE